MYTERETQQGDSANVPSVQRMSGDATWGKEKKDDGAGFLRSSFGVPSGRGFWFVECMEGNNSKG